MIRSLTGVFLLALVATTLWTKPAFAVMEDYPSVRLQGLDKSVGRTITFEAKVGDTIQYGPLFVKIHACRKAPPIEKPESAAFLQIWEVPPGEKKSQWVFSGWMFASSPALSAMDHPVYDVWVLDCIGKEEPAPAAEPDQTEGQNSDQAGENPDNQNTDSAINVPVDSEAQDQTQATPQASNTPEEQTQTSPTDDAQTPIKPSDDGFTAYDLMKQQGQSESAPPTQKMPESEQKPIENPIY